jgi:hypothetical protein
MKKSLIISVLICFTLISCGQTRFRLSNGWVPIRYKSFFKDSVAFNKATLLIGTTDTVASLQDVRDYVYNSGGGTMVYPTAGIAVSAGTSWGTSITNNSTNWNTAYTWVNSNGANAVTAYTDRLKWDGGSTGLTAATGRTSLGATTVGSNFFTLSDPGAITFPQINANNTVSTLSAANFRTAISAEAALGNPGTDGYVLSSSAAGVRSWVANGSGGSMTWPATAGIVVYGGSSAWGTSITDNSTNWNTAYTWVNTNGTNAVTAYTDRLKWDGGATGLTAATGRTSLGATTIGSNIFTLTNPGAITFPRFNADNTISTLSVANFKTALSLVSSDVGLGNVTNESKETILTSSTLTGVPIAPTATAKTNTTQIATTAYAMSTIPTLINDSISARLGGAISLSSLAVMIADSVPGSGHYASNYDLTTGLAAKESSLGNPGTTGYVLSSTTGGTRSWVANGSGSMVYPGAGIPISTGSAWGTSVSSVDATELAYMDGVTSAVQTQLDAKAPKSVTLNAQTGTTYTAVIGDAYKIVTMTNASANTFTIPLNSSVAFPTGTQITIIQGGAGETTIAITSGGTLNSAGSYKDLRVQWSSCTIIKTDTDTWILIGDIEA